MIHETLKKLMDDNKWEEALDILKKQDEPLSDELLESLAWCYSRTGKYNEAVKTYGVLIEKEPDNAKWHYSLGYQHYAQKDYEKAVIYFENALKIYPEYFIVKYRLAYAYLQLAGNYMQFAKNEFWKAINHLEDCHNIYRKYDDEQIKNNKSTYSKICFVHGKALIFSSKHIDRAISNLTKAVELSPDEYDYKYNLAQAYYNKGNLEASMEVLNDLSNIGRPKYYVQELKAQVFSDIGKTDKAIELLHSLVKYRKKDYIYQRLAENYLSMGNIKKAEEFAKLAVDSNNENYKNFIIAGTVLKESKQYITAISYFEKARAARQKKFNQDCPEALRAIDEIMKLTNNNPVNAMVDSNPSKLDYVKNVKKKCGKVIKYNDLRGYGFVSEEKTATNYFFHFTQYPQNIKPSIGHRVMFEVENTEKGMQAIDIELY